MVRLPVMGCRYFPRLSLTSKPRDASSSRTCHHITSSSNADHGKIFIPQPSHDLRLHDLTTSNHVRRRSLLLRCNEHAQTQGFHPGSLKRSWPSRTAVSLVSTRAHRRDLICRAKIPLSAAHDEHLGYARIFPFDEPCISVFTKQS